MTNKTNITNKTYKTNNLIPPHGGYKNLEAYKMAVVIYDGTLAFCNRYMTYKTNKSYRTYDQMVQAARSGKQNIAEASLASATSKKTELKLIGVSRASFQELLEDLEDFLRQKGLCLWRKDSTEAQTVRRLAYNPNKSYMTYKPYIENKNPEIAANTLICLIHQASFLLDQLLRKLEKDFLEKGGFTERLYQKRKEKRNDRTNKTYETYKTKEDY